MTPNGEEPFVNEQKKEIEREEEKGKNDDKPEEKGQEEQAPSEIRVDLEKIQIKYISLLNLIHIQNNFAAESQMLYN